MSLQLKFAIGVAIFLWASAFVGIRYGLHFFSPEGLALGRYLVASVFLFFIYLRLPEKTAVTLKDLLGMMALGAIGIGIYNIALNYGELTVSSGIASFIISQSPVLTAIVAAFLLGEELTLRRLVGFFISIMGVALIAFSHDQHFAWDYHLLYILVATLISGFYSVLQKPFLKKYRALETTTYIIWGATIFLLFYLPALRHDLTHSSLPGVLMVLYLGIFPAALAYLAWSYVLSNIPASTAVSFSYIIPFVTLLLGWVFLGEIPTALSVIGGSIAMAGVWLVNRGGIKYKKIGPFSLHQVRKA